MNEEFNLYEEEFHKYSKALLSKFHQAPTATQQDYREAMEEFSNLKRSLDGMQLSIGNRSGPQFTKLTQYKSEFQQIKQQYTQYVQHTSPTLAMAIQQNEKLIEYTKIAYEAEGHATHIQFELQNQTYKLDGMIRKTNEANQDIGTSESLINRMRNRAIYRKILTYSMVVLILISIILILWYNFF
ncbi:unnamed protein product [Paramecium sonneborni]|uniref:Uncharacterized protein n=1 Tax=Paramecium sonneborni TaxID=65129 RepID=A0A8S1JYF0_9CILI|nr:unnamed protein product [Paramecium sonneborni]